MIARTRSLAIGVAVVLSGAAAGSALAGGTSNPTAAQNRRTATRDAAELLRQLNLPAGANPSAHEPAGDGGALKSPPASPATPNLVDQSKWWTADESPQQVISYVKAHTGGNQNFGGSQGRCKPHTSSPRDCRIVASWVGFSFHGVPGVLAGRLLLVEVKHLKDGSTGIRVDAQVVWISPRPANEKIPAGVRVIDVVRAAHGRPPSVSKTVTRRSAVRKIVALIDQLPITQPGISFGCSPVISRQTVTVTFRASRHGAALARARAPSNVGNSTTVCDPMSFRIKGQSEPSLGQPRSFLVAVQRLLGVQLTSRP